MFHWVYRPHFLCIFIFYIYIISAFWLEFMMLQWTQKGRYLFRTLFSILFDIYAEVGPLELMVLLFLMEHGGYNLYSHQLATNVPFFSTSLPIAIFFKFVFLNITILSGMKWYLIRVLICLSLMIKDVEHFFIHLLAIYIFSFWTCLLESLPHL